MSIMYENRLQTMNARVALRNTRQADKYIFETNRVNLEIYSRSPYYIGSKIWNDLPKNVQDMRKKETYKRSVYDFI